MPRHIDVGAVLSKVYATYGTYFGTLILGALAMWAVLAVFVVVVLLIGLAVGAAGAVAAVIAVYLAVIVGSVWYAGVVVKLVQDVQDGRLDSTLSELFATVRPVVARLVGVAVLIAAAVAGLALVLFLPGVLADSPGLIGLGGVCFLVGLVLLATWWCVSTPAVVVEDVGVTAALGRSRELVRGNAWQVVGVFLVLLAILFVAGVVIGAIGGIGGSPGLSSVLQVGLNVLVAPVFALASAVLYFALREAHGSPGLPGPVGVLTRPDPAGPSLEAPLPPERS